MSNLQIILCAHIVNNFSIESIYNYIFITMQPRSSNYEICISSQLIKIGVKPGRRTAGKPSRNTAGNFMLLPKVRPSLFIYPYKTVKNKDLTPSLLSGTLNQGFKRFTVKEDCF